MVNTDASREKMEVVALKENWESLHLPETGGVGRQRRAWMRALAFFVVASLAEQSPSSLSLLEEADLNIIVVWLQLF